MNLNYLMLRLKGGSGSGNFGHSGRVGKIGGSGKTFSRLTEKFWSGQVDEKGSLSKLETGELGEQIVIQAVKDHLGVNLVTLNVGMNNSPIDLGGEGMAIEVKTGLSSNAEQRWRATLGEFGKAEKELVAQMTPEERKTHYNTKSKMILERKQKLLQELSEMSGEEVKGFTAGVILSPDGKKADVFLVSGFHLSLGWSKYATDENYVGSYEN